MFSIYFCKSCLCLRMLELKVLVSIFMLTMSTFFHKYIVLLIGFCRVHNILLSLITMSWSNRPGSGLHLLTNDGLLVINRSRVLFFLVEKITICSNKQSLNVSRKLLFSFLFSFSRILLWSNRKLLGNQEKIIIIKQNNKDYGIPYLLVCHL